MDLSDNDFEFELTVLSMLKGLMRTRRMISHQTQNVNKEIAIVKRNQTNSAVLKYKNWNGSSLETSINRFKDVEERISKLGR